MQIPTPTPVYELEFNIVLLRGFIYQTEEAIQNNIDKYLSTGPDSFTIEEHPEDNIHIMLNHYMGIDDQSFDLDKTFKIHYPSIMRRSAFLTIFGLLEHEMENFCKIYSKENKININLSDLKGSGFERIALFLKKIVGLTQSTNYPELKKIMKLRNSCAHNDARFVANDGQPIKEIDDLINKYPALLEKDVEQVLFKGDVLLTFLKVFEEYIKEIEAVITPSPKTKSLFQ
ncbi:hypothetical protein D3C80_67970 [compost metagenome]